MAAVSIVKQPHGAGAQHNGTLASGVKKRGLVERLDAGETILCAEGYLLALSRRGYIAHGVWVPEFLLEQPEVLRSVHYEMHHAGSDVMEAFQVWLGRIHPEEAVHELFIKLIKFLAPL